jgi:hypothetical protein
MEWLNDSYDSGGNVAPLTWAVRYTVKAARKWGRASTGALKGAAFGRAPIAFAYTDRPGRWSGGSLSLHPCEIRRRLLSNLLELTGAASSFVGAVRVPSA